MSDPKLDVLPARNGPFSFIDRFGGRAWVRGQLARPTAEGSR